MLLGAYLLGAYHFGNEKVPSSRYEKSDITIQAEIRRIRDKILNEGFRKMTDTRNLAIELQFLKCSSLIGLFPDIRISQSLKSIFFKIHKKIIKIHLYWIIDYSRLRTFIQ